jgi:hypothetical protein
LARYLFIGRGVRSEDSQENTERERESERER